MSKAAAAVQSPTIGRIVHYTLTENDIDNHCSPNGHCIRGDVAPAIITAVHSDTCVNLRVLTDDDASPLHITSANQGEGERHWQWPPRA